MTSTLDPASGVSANSVAERLLDAILGAQFVQAAYLGDRLGYYRALASGGPLTSADLADRTGTAERYAREWLEHQAVTGVLTVDDPAEGPIDRRYTLPAGAAEAFTDPDSPAHVLPMARMICGLGKHLDELVTAYRTGGGGAGPSSARTSARDRPAPTGQLFLGELPRELMPSIPEIAAVLSRGAASRTSAAGTVGRRSGWRWPIRA